MNINDLNDKRPKLPCFVGDGQKITYLYDTGAEVSILKQSKWTDKFEINAHALQQVRFKLQNASGKQMPIMNVLSVQIRAFKKEVKHDFYIVKNLNVPGIMGINLINKLGIGYCPIQKQCFEADRFVAKIHRRQALAPMAMSAVQFKVMKNNDICKNADLYVDIASTSKVLGTSALIRTNDKGIATIMLANCAETSAPLLRGVEIGQIEQPPEDYENAFSSKCDTPFKPASPPAANPTAEQKRFILENAKLDHLSPADRNLYLSMILANHDIISYSEHDLGECSILKHKIPLTNENPIYTNQFQIPLAHLDELKHFVKTSVKTGIMEKTISEWNSPFFFVPKRDSEGNWTKKRAVEDFRKLNEQSVPSNFRLPLISECLQDIGWSNTKLFSLLDLRSSFHQLMLDEKDRCKTAFCVPNMGQFQWTRAAMGLRNVPATYQRLMNIVLGDMMPDKCLAYIDDILLKSPDNHKVMINNVQECFNRLRGANLKINLAKCLLGTQRCTYLGYTLGPEGYQPNDKKVEVIKNAPIPKTKTGIKSFLGMTGFFREMIPDYTKQELQLTKLTRLDSTWKNGTPLPPEALKAFETLKKKVTSKPILAYPQKEGVYHLYVDGSQGETLDEDTGGIAGVLLQEQGPENKLRAISFFSRGLQKHEKNYTVFLTELLACTASIEHFCTYLRGKRFILHCDHRPIVTGLTKNQTRTLNRLQQLMLEYDFTTEYCPGPQNVADYASRLQNVHAIELNSYLTTEKITELQRNDPIVKKVRHFISNKNQECEPTDKKLKAFALEQCSVKENLVYIKEKGSFLLMAPSLLHADLIATAHESLIGGHSSQEKTLGKIQEQFSWPGIRSDVREFIDACPMCDKLKPKHLQTPVRPLPQPDAPLETVHVDLFGPLKTVEKKSFVLVAKDSFTKFALFVAIPDKTPITVASALFNRWVCQYGSAKFLISDNGQEFCSKVSEELYTLWRIKHLKTTPYHPQCNAIAETTNKHIVKYLKTMIESNILDWPLLIPPLMLAYNVGVNKATKVTPFFLLYGVHPRTPYFDGTTKEKVHYGEDYAAEIHQRLQLARAVAKENNIEYRSQYETYHNSKDKHFKDFDEGDTVWLHRPELNKYNRKISFPWDGPYVIIKITPQNALIQHLGTNKTRFVHRDRLRKVVNSQILYEKPEQAPNEAQNKSKEENQPQRNIFEPEIVILNPEDPVPLPKQIPKTEEENHLADLKIEKADEGNLEEQVTEDNPESRADIEIPREEEDDIIELHRSPSPPAEAPIDVETPMPTSLTKAPLLARTKGRILQMTPKKLKKLQQPFTSSQFQDVRLTRHQAKDQNIQVEDQPLPQKPLEHKTRKKK